MAAKKIEKGGKSAAVKAALAKHRDASEKELIDHVKADSGLSVSLGLIRAVKYKKGKGGKKRRGAKRAATSGAGESSSVLAQTSELVATLLKEGKGDAAIKVIEALK